MRSPKRAYTPREEDQPDGGVRLATIASAVSYLDRGATARVTYAT
jgi:hypothetical protein